MPQRSGPGRSRTLRSDDLVKLGGLRFAARLNHRPQPCSKVDKLVFRGPQMLARFARRRLDCPTAGISRDQFGLVVFAGALLLGKLAARHALPNGQPFSPRLCARRGRASQDFGRRRPTLLKARRCPPPVRSDERGEQPCCRAPLP